MLVLALVTIWGVRLSGYITWRNWGVEDPRYARFRKDVEEKGGKLALGSLGCPGFAVGVDLDFKSMRTMPAAPKERLKASP